jgi:hypothetical protein
MSPPCGIAGGVFFSGFSATIASVGPLTGLVEVDETEIACRSKNDPVTGGDLRSSLR